MKIETAAQDVMLPESFEQRDVAIGDIAFILDMFADKVYSHKERAVIRELACNAHDSHVMAGTTDVPFEVHLPTQLEPWFSIRDYGTGLCDADIANVYGAIGVSTKRDSNEVIGCFGIGSLSPYSMCDSFIVKSYLDGMVRTYQCMRDDQRKPKVIPLGSSPTSEANGLEVKLTVDNRVSAFECEAEVVFRFWEGTLPKINNQSVIRACENQRKEYMFKGDDFALSSSWGSVHALMGNIAYKIPSELDEFDCDGYLKFELGELEFDTARENLSMTDKTRAAVKAKFASVKEKLKSVALEQLESKDTVYDKALLANELQKGKLGQLIGSKHLQDYHLKPLSEKFTYWQSKYRGSESYRSEHVPVGKNTEYYIHKDRMQSRIKNYLKDMNSGYTLVIFKDAAQAKEACIPESLLSDLDDLPKVDRQKYTRSSGSTVKTFVFTGASYKDSDNWSEHDLKLDGSEVVYVEINRFQPVSESLIDGSCYRIENAIDVLKKLGITTKVIGLKTAFIKTKAFTNGNFISLNDYAIRELLKLAPTKRYVYDQNNLDTIKTIAKHYECQEAEDIVEYSKNTVNAKVVEILNNLQIKWSVEEDNSLQVSIDSFLNKYSMLGFLSDWQLGRQADKEKIAKYLGAEVKN